MSAGAWSRWVLKSSIIIFATSLLVGSAAHAQTVRITPPAAAIPETYFGMHIHGMVFPRPGMKAPDPWPSVPFGSWRLLDAYVDWPRLEPQKGQWTFTALDRYVELAEQHHVDLLLPLVFSPQWASSRPTEKAQVGAGRAAPPVDMNEWTTYVRTVAGRYKGRIHEYEIWNEPNVTDLFSGTPDQMIALTRAAASVLKEVDPSIVVVSPSAAYNGLPWLRIFLQKGGCKFVDVVGFHFYEATPEDVLAHASQVRSAMSQYGCAGKPLWDTEAGWGITNSKNGLAAGSKGRYGRVLSDAEGAEYVARAYVVNWSAGALRYYWYSWDNGDTGIVEPDVTTLKPAAKAYAEVEKWLVGARMMMCDQYSGLWNCRLRRDGDYSGWIVWDPNKTRDFPIQAAWGVKRMRDLAGNVKSIPGAKSVQIGPAPILLETQAP
jgi:hypothetical protein